MADNKELIYKIKKLKKTKNAVILAHNYQLPEIQDIADFLGDSLELSKISQNLQCKIIVFCGVKFMAQTAKILSQNKKVILPVEDAGCPLADTITLDKLKALKSKYKDAKVVSYVNTPAEIKAESHVCCTSSNAIKVVRHIDTKRVIFVPDKNLGRWVEKNVHSKDLIIWQGSCHIHEQFTIDDLKSAKEAYPQAQVLVHPECRPEVQESADFILSTAGMLKRAKASKAKSFIIGTEEGLLYKLKKDNPEKEFYSLGERRICKDMKKTTLTNLYQALAEEKYEINLEEDIMKKARVALEEMVKLA